MMKPKKTDLIKQNTVFLWIAIITAVALLIPLIAMQFTNEVHWGLMDFLVMGVLLFSASSLFVLVSRKVSYKQRALIAFLFFAGFLLIWAELAVGIFS